jgi:hypothetical protein
MALQHVRPGSPIAGPDEHLAALRRERVYAEAKGKNTADIDAEIDRFSAANGLVDAPAPAEPDVDPADATEPADEQPRARRKK